MLKNFNLSHKSEPFIIRSKCQHCSVFHIYRYLHNFQKLKHKVQARQATFVDYGRKQNIKLLSVTDQDYVWTIQRSCKSLSTHTQYIMTSFAHLASIPIFADKMMKCVAIWHPTNETAIG
jgi:hypothetical protein